MWFEDVLFFVAGIGALAGALGVILVRNPFYSVLALVGHLISLAVLFLMLDAQFVAAAQVVVYAGAVMVLYIFVVAYIGGSDEPLRPEGGGVAVRTDVLEPDQRPVPRGGRRGEYVEEQVGERHVAVIVADV